MPEPELDDANKLAALQMMLETEGVVPPPPQTVTQRLEWALVAIASTLIGAGFGLVSVLGAWYTYRLVF